MTGALTPRSSASERLLCQMVVTYHVIRNILLLLSPQEGLRATLHPNRQPQGTPHLGNMRRDLGWMGDGQLMEHFVGISVMNAREESYMDTDHGRGLGFNVKI